MYDTKYVQKRAQQRGITKDMINFTLDHGVIQGDRWFLNRKLLNETIHELEAQLKVAKRLRDKGGVVVVADGEALLTTYDYDSRKMAY